MGKFNEKNNTFYVYICPKCDKEHIINHKDMTWKIDGMVNGLPIYSGSAVCPECGTEMLARMDADGSDIVSYLDSVIDAFDKNGEPVKMTDEEINAEFINERT